MSWQEELRKLDEELAAGQISADDYRVRRDQVLSSAVSFGPAGPAGQTAQPSKPDETQFIPPGPPAPPPPPRPQTGPPDSTQIVGNQEDADKTQIVPGSTTEQADRTQAVGSWQTARPTDADRTQVVPGVPPQAFAGGQPPRPAPDQGFPPAPGFPPPMGWQQPEDDFGPPWGGGVFPPLAPSASPEWARQGPEVFEEGSSSTGKKVMLILLIVLVLGGLGTGFYFLVLKKDNNPSNPGGAGGSSSSQRPRPTTTTKPRPADPNVAILEDMPNPPASLQQQGQVLSLAQLAEQKLLDAPEVELLRVAGVTKVPWRSAVRKSPDDGPTPDAMSTMVIPTGSEAEAEQLLQSLRAYQETQGLFYIPEPLPNMPPSVVFEKAVVTERALYRGLYVSGKNVVRVTTIQAPLTNEASLSGSYRNQTEAMLKAFPAEQ